MNNKLTFDEVFEKCMENPVSLETYDAICDNFEDFSELEKTMLIRTYFSLDAEFNRGKAQNEERRLYLIGLYEYGGDEVKNSIIEKNTKANHHAYIGDAQIGKNCNIGCGAIFVNYNGKIKQKIKVGNNCFIGSNCNIVAPVQIEDNCYICAGSTVTKNTNAYDFVIARSRETIKQNYAKKYLNKEH